MKRLALLVFLVPAVALSAPPVKQWRDADGRLHFGDTPAPGANATTMELPQKAEPSVDAIGPVFGIWRGQRGGHQVQLYLHDCGRFDEQLLIPSGNPRYPGYLHSFRGEWKLKGIDLSFAIDGSGPGVDAIARPRRARVYQVEPGKAMLIRFADEEQTRFTFHGDGRNSAGVALIDMPSRHCTPAP